MTAFIIILALFVGIMLTFIVVRSIFVSFIDDHSVRIQNEKKMNEEFQFYEIADLSQSHTYDNEKMYEGISSEDYLIYQLQSMKKPVLEEMERCHYNKMRYEEYLKIVSDERLIGKYDKDPKRYWKKLLFHYEEKEYRKFLKHPTCELEIQVHLSLARMNGEVYQRKCGTFSEDEITELLRRLNNKNGSFYNDREIWNSIVRVERGRLSNKLRFAVYKRDGYRCCYCHKSQNSALLEIDHIVPIAKGGKTTMDNLQTLCHDCNVRKGDKLI